MTTKLKFPLKISVRSSYVQRCHLI